MATLGAISLSSSTAKSGEYFTITGTNLEDGTGSDPITSITFDTTPAITITDYIVDSATSIRIRVPSTDAQDSITITNSTNSVTSSDLSVELGGFGEWDTLPTSATGTFTVEELKGSGSWLTQPVSAKGTFTVEELKGSGSWTTLPVSAKGTFTIAAQIPSYTGSFTVTLSDDCETITMLDTTTYGTRTDFEIVMKLKNLRNGKIITTTPNTADKQAVVSWTASVDKDGVYEAEMIDEASGVIRAISNKLINCVGEDCQDDIESDIANLVAAGNGNINLQRYKLIYGLNATIDICYDRQEYDKVHENMDYIDSRFLKDCD